METAKTAEVISDSDNGKDVRLYLDMRQSYLSQAEEKINNVFSDLRVGLNATDICLAREELKITFFHRVTDRNQYINPCYLRELRLIYREFLEVKQTSPRYVHVTPVGIKVMQFVYTKRIDVTETPQILEEDLDIHISDTNQSLGLIYFKETENFIELKEIVSEFQELIWS